MVLQEGGDGAAQLPGAVAVNDAHLLLIGHVVSSRNFSSRVNRLVHRAADHVQLGQRPFARLQIDIDTSPVAGAARAPAADRPQVLQLRPQALAAHVDLRLLAVHLDDRAFEP